MACICLVVLASEGAPLSFLKHCTESVVLFVITEVVLYYCGQCSNATVGVGVGRGVAIVLLYRLRDVRRG